MRAMASCCGELLALCWQQSPRKLIWSVVLKLIATAALPLSAVGVGLLMDAAVAGDGSAAAMAAAATAALLIAALTLSHFAHVMYFELGEMNLLTKERQLIELASGSVGLEHHERPDYADRVQVLRHEVERVGHSSMEALLSTASVVLSLVLTSVILAQLDPLLLLLPLAGIPAVHLGARAQALQAAGREAAAEPTRLARHLFSVATQAGPAKEVRTAGLADELKARHATLWSAGTRTMLPAELRAAGLRIIGQLLFAAGYVSAILVVVAQAIGGGLSVGDVLVVFSVAGLANHQVSAAVSVLQDLQRVARVMADFRWLEALVTRPLAPVGSASPRTVPRRLEHGIELRDVTFTYPLTDRPVLQGIDVLLPAGATVAIVGENGSGKTSLVKLLCRFYEPSQGVIEVDGVPLADLPSERWRERTAGAFQDFVNFELVARESVGLGDVLRIESEAAVLTGLRRAHSEAVLRRLSHGLATQLGKSYTDGTELSKGQWQKLALGRAMMRDAPLLLVLDEPTAALDAEAEHHLFEQYAANARRLGEAHGTVTLLVSHRFSTVRMADLILVVADGRVAESGTHEALVAAGGLYANLYGMQERSYR